MENSEIRTSYARADSPPPPPSFFFKLVCPYPRPRCTLPFFPPLALMPIARIPPRPNWRTVFRNRQVGLRAAQLGMCGLRREANMCSPRKVDRFLRRLSPVSHSSVHEAFACRSPRRVLSMRPDALIFLPSPSPFPSHPLPPLFYVFLFFSNYQS